MAPPSENIPAVWFLLREIGRLIEVHRMRCAEPALQVRVEISRRSAGAPLNELEIGMCADVVGSDADCAAKYVRRIYKTDGAHTGKNMRALSHFY